MNFSKILQEKGLRSTPQRCLILEILKKTSEHLCAEEIFLQVTKIQPSVSFGTIYRNLSLLCNTGLVRSLDFKDGKIRYELNNQEHHHHMVCIQCGQTININTCPLNDHINNIADKFDFNITGHDFEIFGYCSNCSEENKF